MKITLIVSAEEFFNFDVWSADGRQNIRDVADPFLLLAIGGPLSAVDFLTDERLIPHLFLDASSHLYKRVCP